MVYYYQGNFSDSLSIDVNNLALLRGYCAFEYLRTYNKKPFCLEAHLRRFFYSMEKMGLDSPLSFDELIKITHSLIEKEKGECGVKWYATGGLSPDGLRHQAKADLFAFTLPMSTPAKELYEVGIKTKTYKVARPLPDAKTTAYFQACQILSNHKDLHEILYLNQNNQLLEASTSNLFLIKDNTIYTAVNDILHGITREVVLGLVKDKYPIVYCEVNYQDLEGFDEVFITATNKEVLPVSKIDYMEFKVGPATKNIMNMFKDLTMSIQPDLYVPSLYQNELLHKT